MSKDIREFLKYYIGCECLATGDIRVRFAGTIYRENEDWPLVQRYKGGEPQGQSFPLPNWDHIKPILRKLESMTEDEAIEVARIEGLVNAEIATKGSAFIQLNDDSYSLVICSNGELESVKDGRIIRTTKANDIFNYLIKRKIWIFGNDWFDEGYIIDKATVK